MNIHSFSLSELWRYELLLIDSNSVKVNNIIVAVIMILIGFSLAKHISIWLKNLIYKTNKDKDASNTLHKISFYTLSILYGITVLEVANIPLNAFAFIGGALAISVGLGAKQLLNNFISGLLMIIEKPVRIGDIVKVNDVVGQIKSINARSTVVMQANGTQMIIPNSGIMQHNLTSWSYNGKNLLFNVIISIEVQNCDENIHKTLHTKLEKAIKSSELLNYVDSFKVMLFNINKGESQFLLKIEIQEANINNIASIKNELNYALLRNLEGNFSTHYPAYLSS